jgi:hypothetical protein
MGFPFLPPVVARPHSRRCRSVTNGDSEIGSVCVERSQTLFREVIFYQRVRIAKVSSIAVGSRFAHTQVGFRDPPNQPAPLDAAGERRTVGSKCQIVLRGAGKMSLVLPMVTIRIRGDVQRADANQTRTRV